MEKSKKKYVETGIVLASSLIISILIILIVAISTKQKSVTIGPDDTEEVDNFDEFRARENIFKLMNNQLTLNGKNEDEVTDLLSLSWNENTHSLNCSGYVSDPIDNLIINMDINLNEEYTLNSIIKEFGDGEIRVTDYSINCSYQLAEEADDFINNSEFKNDFKESNVSYVGITQDLNEDHYYYGTYKDGSRCISINGLKFDSTTYEYSKLNIAKTDVSINEGKYIYKLLYLIL